MKIPTGSTQRKNPGARIAITNETPAQVPAERKGRNNRNRLKKGPAEWTNCQTAIGDDTKLLLHNK
jgi:hypothetical protein